jgi:hypothetical protein
LPYRIGANVAERGMKLSHMAMRKILAGPRSGV